MDGNSDFLPRKRKADRLAEWHFQDDDFAGSYPVLYSLLACARMDGVWREGASFTVFADSGELKAVVSDRQTEQVLFLTLDPAKPLLEQLEGFIRSHAKDWREKKNSSKK